MVAENHQTEQANKTREWDICYYGNTLTTSVLQQACHLRAIFHRQPYIKLSPNEMEIYYGHIGLENIL